MIRFGMALVEMIEQLTKGFVKATGRQPDNLEKIKIQQEAVQRFKDMNKVVDMEGSPIDTSKGIMGGKQADKFISQNKTMIDEAIDNASPGFSGDTKIDAELVAEDLAERMGKVYDDLPTKQRLDLYDQAYTGLSKQRFKNKPEPEDMAQGGRAGFKFGLGPLLKSMSKTSPQQAYKKYLQSVKDRAKKGDMKSLAPELGAVTAGGVFINRRMQDVLKNLKEKDMENNLKNFRKELNADPFYKDYPELKDKILENYTEKMFGEKRADGGRIGLKDGMTRRTFLKLLGGLASIPIVGKILKPMKVGKTVTKVPMIKTDNVAGKPEWFDALVNKVIIEGDDVTKKFATQERQIVHSKDLGDGTTVRVTQDMDQGAVRVEYDSPDNVFEDTVQMEYKKPLPDEGAPRPAAEFTTAESGPVGRQVSPDDYDIDIEEVGGSSIRDLDSDVSKLKEYATGKKPTMKELVQNIERRKKAQRITEDPEAQSDAVIRRQGEMLDYDTPDDFASGGIARMLGE